MSDQKDRKMWTFPEDQRLFNLGFWAGQISWLVLIFGILRLVLFFLRTNQFGWEIITGGGRPLEIAIFILSNLTPLTTSIFLWFLLQAVKELLFAIIDIKDLLTEDESEMGA